MDRDQQDLFFRAIDGTISSEDFERLQLALEQDQQTREEYLRVVALCETLGELAERQVGSDPASNNPSGSDPQGSGSGVDIFHGDLLQESAEQSGVQSEATRWFNRSRLPWIKLAVAAAILLAVGSASFWLGNRNRTANVDLAEGLGSKSGPDSFLTPGGESGQSSESQIAGHATLRRAVNLSWADQMKGWREGDVLPNGPLAFDEGLAEIDLFCGATLIVEGPARLHIESDWSVRVDEGLLRAHVPPAARGFIVRAADSEIIDLGTEFALSVDSDSARVEVIDGEIELRGGDHHGKHLLTGQGESLKGASPKSDLVGRLNTSAGLTVAGLGLLRREADAKLFERWVGFSHSVRRDERLIAYYPISQGIDGRTVPNVVQGKSNQDGLVVGPAEVTSGRFGEESYGLEFGRPGARVRTRIEGEFHAFTFVCWARIDSLEHRYNALFMADSYENGEPHWQIREDGKLMFSVMVDDTKKIRHFSEIDQKMVTQAGLHRVYYSPPIWDLSKSGQWFHLAAVYDPAGQTVNQYVNGERISSDVIVEQFRIQKLGIGAAEIGNWGQPFRKTAWFAVRNLNGTIDELAIYNAALGDNEIREHFLKGKPVGY